MASELRRLGQTPDLQDQAERITFIFARGLSGQHAEAFVDALAHFRARR
jgi:hypothetical protein